MDRGKREHLSAICIEISDLPGTVRGGGLAENGSFLPRKKMTKCCKITHTHTHTNMDKHCQTSLFSYTFILQLHTSTRVGIKLKHEG